MFFGHGIPLSGLCWLPVLLLPHLLLTVGLGWLLAALGVFLRDISQIVPFALQLILYASAIFYSRDIVPHSVWMFLKWNPLLENIRLARNALLWNKPVAWGPLVYIYVFDSALFLVGGWFFQKTKPAFADVI
jgi:lipopolysaccharide transport system permease protein